MVDTSKQINVYTTSEVPESGTIALTMGVFSLIFLVVVSLIFSLVHKTFF